MKKGGLKQQTGQPQVVIGKWVIGPWIIKWLVAAVIGMIVLLATVDSTPNDETAQSPDAPVDRRQNVQRFMDDNLPDLPKGTVQVVTADATRIVINTTLFGKAENIDTAVTICRTAQASSLNDEYDVTVIDRDGFNLAVKIGTQCKPSSQYR